MTFFILGNLALREVDNLDLENWKFFFMRPADVSVGQGVRGSGSSITRPSSSIHHFPVVLLHDASQFDFLFQMSEGEVYSGSPTFTLSMSWRCVPGRAHQDCVWASCSASFPFFEGIGTKHLVQSHYIVLKSLSLCCVQSWASSCPSESGWSCHHPHCLKNVSLIMH